MVEEIDIVIVSFNSFTTITQCLDELISSKKYMVTVVDNASPDGSADKLRERYPYINIIALDENVGFGRGANVGLMASQCEYSFLVNPDLMLSSSCVSTLVAQCKRIPDLAVLAPAIDEVDYLQQGVQSREWVSGAAMIFHRDCFRKFGYFDEQIFLFFEETDLCHRIIKGGGKICVDTDVLVKHLAGQSCGSSPGIEYFKWWHYGWSQQYFYKKHGWGIGKKSAARLLFTSFYKYVFSFKVSRRRQYRARFFGGVSFLLNREFKKKL